MQDIEEFDNDSQKVGLIWRLRIRVDAVKNNHYDCP
jgi:hypothetical protein